MKIKCKNCGEEIDEFKGIRTGARAWLHVIKISDGRDGFLWGWSEESKKFCRNPEP